MLLSMLLLQTFLIPAQSLFLPQANHYDVVWHSKSPYLHSRFTAREVIFNGPEDDLPDPAILQVKWILFCVLHSSAAAEELLLPALRFEPDEVQALEAEADEGMFALYSLDMKLGGQTVAV